MGVARKGADSARQRSQVVRELVSRCAGGDRGHRDDTGAEEQCLVVPVDQERCRDQLAAEEVASDRNARRDYAAAAASSAFVSGCGAAARRAMSGPSAPTPSAAPTPAMALNHQTTAGAALA